MIVLLDAGNYAASVALIYMGPLVFGGLAACLPPLAERSRVEAGVRAGGAFLAWLLVFFAAGMTAVDRGSPDPPAPASPPLLWGAVAVSGVLLVLLNVLFEWRPRTCRQVKSSAVWVRGGALALVEWTVVVVLIVAVRVDDIEGLTAAPKGSSRCHLRESGSLVFIQGNRVVLRQDTSTADYDELVTTVGPLDYLHVTRSALGFSLRVIGGAVASRQLLAGWEAHDGWSAVPVPGGRSGTPEYGRTKRAGWRLRRDGALPTGYTVETVDGSRRIRLWLATLYRTARSSHPTLFDESCLVYQLNERILLVDLRAETYEDLGPGRSPVIVPNVVSWMTANE